MSESPGTMARTPGNKKKLRILFLTRWYPDATDPQLGVFVKKHAQAAACFDDVTLAYISPHHPERHVTDLYLQDEEQVRQLFLHYRQSRFAWLNALRYFLKINRAWKAALKNAGRPDVIHANLLTRTGLLALYLSRRHGVPYVITEHWTGFVNGKYRKKPAWYRWLARQVVKRAAALTVVSDSLRKAMVELGFGPEVKVIPNVVDVPARTAVQAHAKTRFLTVADLLDEQKNISATLRATARIAADRQDFEFHLIGGGPDEDMLKKLSDELGIKNTFVFFHGRKTNEEVYQHILSSDFVVVNSRVETFSVVTAEALACGKPVVATISGGPEEIITAETGMLIEKDNGQELEKAIRTMLDTFKTYDPVRLRVSVEARFGRKETGLQLHQLYSAICRTGK